MVLEGLPGCALHRGEGIVVSLKIFMKYFRASVAERTLTLRPP